jgi:hypothetical protein
VRFCYEPKGTSLRILADSEPVSGMDYGAVKLDHSLKSAPHVIHNEIRQRECVARPGPAFMDTYLGRIGTSLPTLSLAILASIELNVQHTLPESEGARRVVGWKLDERDGRAIHAPTIAALEENGSLGWGRFGPRQKSSTTSRWLLVSSACAMWVPSSKTTHSDPVCVVHDLHLFLSGFIVSTRDRGG